MHITTSEDYPIPSTKIILTLFIALICFPALKAYGQDMPKFESKYTSLVQCKTVKSLPSEHNDGGYTETLCPGLDGYKVYVISEHIYTSLAFKKGKDKINIFTEGAKVNVPIVSGSQLEWRYKNQNGNKKLIAWIYRVAGEDLKNFDKIKRPLQVIRFEPENRKWCLLAETDTNEEAQKIADSDKGCGGLAPFGLY